ncbi:TPA: ABC transporter ATP-binding protein [bacterium]|nr:ABC transporter ATP-binding protein [bacterium]
MRKLFFLFKMFFKISPMYVIILFLASIFSSFQVFLNVILPKFLVDELLGKQDIQKTIIIASIIVLANVLFIFINKSFDRYNKVKSLYIENKLLAIMSKKIMSTKFQYLEDPYYLDLKEKAVFAWRNQNSLKRAINHSIEIFKAVITLSGLVAILLTLDFIIVGAMVLIVIITLILRALFIKYQLTFVKTIVPINRKYNYYISLANDIRYSKDIKLYEMGDMISDSYYKYNDMVMNEFGKLYVKDSLIEGSISVINSIQTFITYLYIGYKVFVGQIGLGSFTMYVNGASNFSSNFKNLFDNFLGLFQCISYLDPFIEFMHLEDEEKVEAKHVLDRPIEKIEFVNVSFKYPKSDKLILDNISFIINKGEKISIVGLNGAGKTTLVKLLCRLYKPDEGEIYVNGINIQDYDYLSYINEISAVFQDYKLFDYSIKDNIITTNEEDDKKLNGIIDEVGLKDRISELKNGVNTNLNRNFDLEGVELSQGQMQKVAIARSLYKDSSLVILDEPTSALDPLSEADIYQNFNSMVKDKTAIYISHRMSSSVFCDKILVIEEGKVKDYDTHSNLMKKTDSLYYKLFNSQAKNYSLQ